jgi:hypothetical protein
MQVAPSCRSFQKEKSAIQQSFRLDQVRPLFVANPARTVCVKFSLLFVSNPAVKVGSRPASPASRHGADGLKTCCDADVVYLG